MSPRSDHDVKVAPLDVNAAPTDELGVVPVISDSPEPEVGGQPLQIVWRNVILMSGLHIAALYGIYLLPQATISTLVWSKYKMRRLIVNLRGLILNSRHERIRRYRFRVTF